MLHILKSQIFDVFLMHFNIKNYILSYIDSIRNLSISAFIEKHSYIEAKLRANIQTDLKRVNQVTIKKPTPHRPDK